MSDATRSRITITLGRSGQVVKRAGPAAEDDSFSDLGPSVGSKRSVKDRLGSNFDSVTQFDSRRQRGDGSRLSLSASNDVDDLGLSKNDLRFKIMRKTILDRSQGNGIQNELDLRDMLSRPAQSSTTSLGRQLQRMPPPNDARKHLLEPVYGRQHLPEPRKSRQLLPEPRDGRQHISEPRDYRLQPSEARDARHGLPVLKDVRHFSLGSNSSSLPRPMLSSRSMDALPQMESLSSYSPWTLESLRQRPSDRFPGTSGGVSPPRKNEEQERRSLVRAYDDSIVASYASEEAFGHSRFMSSTSHLQQTVKTVAPAKPMVSLPAPLPPSVSLAQRSSYTVDDQASVDSFLHSLGLDKYVINFKAEEVDMYSLKQMDDNDLKELGVPMGPRKKIMLALHSRARRQA